jgi:hypothetical protein
MARAAWGSHEVIVGVIFFGIQLVVAMLRQL